MSEARVPRKEIGRKRNARFVSLFFIFVLNALDDGVVQGKLITFV